jgi:hypothetical protein
MRVAVSGVLFEVLINWLDIYKIFLDFRGVLTYLTGSSMWPLRACMYRFVINSGY